MVQGIMFFTDLHEIIDMNNHKTKLEEMKKIILKWNYSRSLNAIGRLTVIKTLPVPKVNIINLILALPNPSEEVIRFF